ncbi:Arylacetamide deacetylase [Fusarium oxysporum f. sp. albedinis]|nr:Arylacetamide deacetylase [Fusarium oxysporum f. sp. albedinis]
MAMEIGIDWGKEDDAGRVRLAIFGCEILLLTWRHHKLIDRGFLSLEIEGLGKLEGKLLRGVNPGRRGRIRQGPSPERLA